MIKRYLSFLFVTSLFIITASTTVSANKDSDVSETNIVGNPEAICETTDTPILLKEQIEENIKKDKELEVQVKALRAAKEREPKGITIALCSNSPTKTYMDGKRITNKTSKAYRVLKTTTLSEDGFYKQGEYYAVALGNYYGNDGTKYRVTLSTGKQFYIIKTDTKADAETNNRCTHINDGSMIEFIVDIPTIKKTYPKAATYGNFDYSDIFHGSVVKMEKIIS